MSRRQEILLVTLILLIGALFRAWGLSRLPPGFSNEELAYIRLTEAVQGGDISVYYQVGDGHGRAGLYAAANAVANAAVGDGLMGHRLLPFWAGLLTLALLYTFTRRLFGRPAALLALAAMSLNVRAVLLARTATAEALIPLYVLLTAFVLAVAFHVGRTVRFRAPVTGAFALLAVLFGMSGYLHYSTLVLGPLGALFVIHLLITRQPLSRRVWSALAFVLVLATVVALPYITSTVREPTTSEPDILIVERPRSVRELADGVLGAIGGVIWEGDAGATTNLPGLPLLGPLATILALVGLVHAVRRWREPRYALVLLALAAGMATDMWLHPEPTFSANLVALPALMILPAIGMLVLWHGLRLRNPTQTWRPVTALIVLILLANAALTARRVFASWADHPAVETAYHANLGRVAAYLDREAAGPPVAICAVPLREPNEVGLTKRQIVPLMMHREGVKVRYVDCRSGLVFINAGADMRVLFFDPEDRTAMPPELAEWFSAAEEVAVEGLPAGALWHLNVEQRIRDMGGYWDSAAHTFYLPDAPGSGSLPASLPVPLERNLTFAGYDPRGLRPHVAGGGDPIVLATYWRVDGPLPSDLGIFVHLLAYLNPRLEPLAEANGIAVIPSELENRDIFVQVSYVWLSDRLRAGIYPLTVGAYTGQVAVLENHLGVIDREIDSTLRGERLLISEIEVLAAELPAEDAAQMP